MKRGKLTIHGFETSNNMKVRIALGFKQIPYTFRAIDPRDRSTVKELSGQHLTPVMQHGDVVLFDSAAILRYIEAEFPDAPRLFGHSHREQWEIEDWELFARATLAGPLMELVHHKVYGGTVDEAMQKRCAGDFAAAARKLAGALEDREWLVGDAMTAADVTAAPVIFRVLAGEMFELPAGSERVRGWVDRVMVFDEPR